MRVSGKAFEKLALEQPDEQWELHCGKLVRKPGMTTEHNDIMFELGHMLRLQLPRDAYRVRVNAGHAKRSARDYFIPDVSVIPIDLVRSLWGRIVLEVYSDPLPLVVEVWSPSTGAYDISTKLPEYQRRGDEEIWRVHPYDRTVTIWRKMSDGSYSETVHTGGTVRLSALPEVTIDLDALFE